jgi:hypothetical protein
LGLVKKEKQLDERKLCSFFAKPQRQRCPPYFSSNTKVMFSKRWISQAMPKKSIQLSSCWMRAIVCLGLHFFLFQNFVLAQNKPLLSADSIKVCEKSIAEVPIRAFQFQKILGFQFAMRWPKGLKKDSIIEIHPTVAKDILFGGDDTTLTIFWVDENARPKNISDSTILFKIRLRRFSTNGNLFMNLRFASEEVAPIIALDGEEVIEDSIRSKDSRLIFAKIPDYTKSKDTLICSGEVAKISIKAPTFLAYKWASGETSTSVQVQKAASYPFTVRDSLGCMKTDSIRVDTASLPASSGLPRDTTICKGKKINLKVPEIANQTVLWSTGNKQALQENLGEGKFWVTNTNQWGCKRTDSMLINTFEQKVFKLEKTDGFCGQNNGSLVVKPNQSGLYQYKWSTLDTTAAINNLPAGAYSVKVIDQNGCDTTIQASISRNISPALSYSVLPSLCKSSNGKIRFITNDLNNLQVSLDNKVFINGNTLEGLPSGKYQVYIKNQGCDTVVNITMYDSTTLKNLTVSPQNPTCEQSNGSIQVLAQSKRKILYQINGSGFKEASNFANLAAGQYQISIKNEDGCTVDTILSLSNKGKRPNLSVSTSPARCNLTNGKIIAQVPNSAGSTILFSLDSLNFKNTNEFTGLNPGQYKIFANDQGCISSANSVISRDTLVPFQLAKIETSAAFCNSPNGKANLILSGKAEGVKFQLGQFSSTKPLFDRLKPGAYEVTARDTNGCSVKKSFSIANVERPPLKLDVYTEGRSCSKSDGTIRITKVQGGLAPYQYSINDSNRFQENENFGNLPFGIYKIFVRDQSDCPATSILAEIKRINCNSFIPNSIAPNGHEQNRKLIVFAPDNYIKTIKSYRIFDRWGGLIYQAESNQAFATFDQWWDGKTNINSKSKTINGVYLYQIELEYVPGFEREPRLKRGEFSVVE